MTFVSSRLRHARSLLSIPRPTFVIKEVVFMEEVLLLFDARHPCWSQKTVILEGEDPENLERLERAGFLEKKDALYILTFRGRTRYREMADHYCLPCLPGNSPENLERAHRRTLLELLLNRGFQGRWGIKEFRPGELLEYAPPLSPKELWEESEEGFRWLYPEHREVRQIRENWPLPLEIPAADSSREERWNSWAGEKNLSHGLLELDLLFLHHYDSEHFQHLSPPPGDIHGLFHTDRFYFQFLPSSAKIPEGLWNELGQFQLWMMLQRRIFLPWYFDRDTTNYDSIPWWFWVTPREEDLELLSRYVSPRGKELTEPALPLQLFGISLEALEENEEKHEYHWDLFEKIARPLSPAL